MNRLIKAEWYRVRHSSKLMRWLLFVCMWGLVFPLMEDFEVYKYNLTEHLFISQGTAGVFLMCFLATFSTVLVGMSYMNKTAYYEVMAGNKISKILLSKVVVNASLVTVVQSLFFGVCWALIAINNGKGQITQLPLRLFLFVIMIFHACIVGVLIATSIRSIAASVLTYLRFAAFEMIILMVIRIFQDSIPVKTAEKIVDWFSMMKITKILSYEYEITNHLIFTVIAGMLLEAAVWYVISYVGMKKKLYK